MCDKSQTAANGLSLLSLDDCEATLGYTSKDACYIQYLPLMKYTEQVSAFAGAILILFGAIMCFLGSKFLPIMIGFLGCLLITVLVSLVGFNFLDPTKAQSWHFIILVVAALAFGIIAGLAAYKLAKDWGVMFLAFWLGIMLAMFVLKVVQVQNQNYTILAAAVGGIGGAYLGKTYNRGIKKFGTAIIGSFLLIRGVSMYLGNFPSEFNSVGSFKDGSVTNVIQADDPEMLYYTIGYLVAFLGIAFAGAVFQFRQIQDDDEGKDNFDDQEEARCCGVF